MPVQSSIFEYCLEVLYFTAMWHLLGSWLMVVWSLAAMRERDLFGSFEPQPPNRLYIYCHVGNFPSGCDISPTQPYPCSFVCLSFAETVSSGFSSVHCISSESKSVIKLPKPCKHGNLPIKCEWNAVTHKRQAPYQFTQALNNGHWNKLRISQDLNVWIPLPCQMLPNLAWSLMLILDPAHLKRSRWWRCLKPLLPRCPI